MSKVLDTRLVGEIPIGEFWELYEQRYGVQPLSSQDNVARSHGRLVFGLNGIRGLFNCSHKQAQYYKDHVIQEAVSQNGRKIVVDADLALELFNERRKKK